MTDRPWRVLIHPFYFLPEQWNGMDEHLLLLSRHLDRSRFELLLLTHPTDGPQSQALAERAGIRAIAAPYGSGAGFRQRVAALRALYARERVDLVHLHSPAAGGQAASALAARLAGVKATLATYHQVQAQRLSAKSRLVNSLTHRFLVRRTMAVSRGVKETLVSAAGLPMAKIDVVHNGIDRPSPVDGTGAVPAGLPARVPGEVWLAYFGRLSPEKGLKGVLQALARLAPCCPEARLLIAGDGPERTDLESLAAELAIADRVHFLGWRADARAIMEQVDVVVHAPVYEGFGLAVLEAMAAGRAVVGNDSPGGVSEIIVHGQT
ncbi:MAG: glycosyltransferase, partial [Chloroflexota bacterium]